MRVRIAGRVEEAVGALLWSKAKNIPAMDLGKPSQTAWYDHSYYKVPVVGDLDLSKIRSKLHEKAYRPSAGKFGGGTSLGDVWDAGDGHVFVELIYHIGD